MTGRLRLIGLLGGIALALCGLLAMGQGDVSAQSGRCACEPQRCSVGDRDGRGCCPPRFCEVTERTRSTAGRGRRRTEAAGPTLAETHDWVQQQLRDFGSWSVPTRRMESSREVLATVRGQAQLLDAHGPQPCTWVVDVRTLTNEFWPDTDSPLTTASIGVSVMRERFEVQMAALDPSRIEVGPQPTREGAQAPGPTCLTLHARTGRPVVRHMRFEIASRAPELQQGSWDQLQQELERRVVAASEGPFSGSSQLTQVALCVTEAPLTERLRSALRHAIETCAAANPSPAEPF